jgi:glutathione-specific gamma-glutamylcyclotransferase
MISPRKMRLTADHVARVHRVEPDEGPHPQTEQMTEADYAQLSAELVADLGGEPIRVFAYGSLIWKPEFEHVKHFLATLPGWHRSFCMKIERWRGTRASPGLMMALDRGGSCRGVVYELPRGREREQMEKLIRREMTNRPATNVPRWLTVTHEGVKSSALTFTSSRSGPTYAGRQTAEEIAKVLACAAGHWGSCAEYLFNTVSHLEELGIRDRGLWNLQKLVAAEIERQAKPT